jgi:predicted transposase/invertase (TIGR01784 family)
VSTVNKRALKSRASALWCHDRDPDEAAIHLNIPLGLLSEPCRLVHLEFQLRSQRPPLQLTDCLQIHLLELPKYTPASDNGIITDPIEKWVHFFRRAKDSTPQELIDRLGEEVFAEASGVLEMIAKTPRERELYEARLKLQRDEHGRLQAAEDQGRAEGRVEGRVEGRAEGRAEGRVEGLQVGERAGSIRVLERLMQLPISEDLETRSLEELASLERELERKFRDRNQQS